MSLVYGETTATATSGNYLVILAASSADGASVFASGRSYTFRFVATNSLGRSDYDTITMKATRQPWGGNFTVNPKNGTTMITPFAMTTKDWTVSVAPK